MSLGVIMLVHTALDRAAQVARHFAESGCKLAIHCDRATPAAAFAAFKASLSDLPDIRFVRRRRCEWGTWGIVGATQDAAERLLVDFPDVAHVYLMSGSCLPLRPVAELQSYLAANPGRDFIESVTIDDIGWAKGGLEQERFTRIFPFPWKRQRWLFERWIRMQRRLGLKRRVPEGLVPHLGSQWWCLSRETLAAILLDPRRAEFDRFFRHAWIPDESYFQTLARHHSDAIESRPLTLSKFDDQGRPHVFYDDHLRLLMRSDCFIARKIWPGADRLYHSFLDAGALPARRAAPNPGKIDRLFSKATDRRRHGRAGLYMQSRFPMGQAPNRQSAGPYSVFQGFGDLFPEFETWLAQTTGTVVHGRLYHPKGAVFSGRERTFSGALSASAPLRDHNPCGFLTNLLWSTRGTRQSFLYHPADNQYPWNFMAGDPNAQIQVISGAWALGLFRGDAGLVGPQMRADAARLQAVEERQLQALTDHYAKARVRVWTLSDFVDQPMEHLEEILDEMALRRRPPLAEAPRMLDLRGFGDFLQKLRNEGLNVHVAGHFPPGSTLPGAPDMGAPVADPGLPGLRKRQVAGPR